MSSDIAKYSGGEGSQPQLKTTELSQKYVRLVYLGFQKQQIRILAQTPYSFRQTQIYYNVINVV